MDRKARVEKKNSKILFSTRAPRLCIVFRCLRTLENLKWHLRKLSFIPDYYDAFFLSKFSLLVVFTCDLRFSNQYSYYLTTTFVLFYLDSRFRRFSIVLFKHSVRYLSSTFLLFKHDVRVLTSTFFICFLKRIILSEKRMTNKKKCHAWGQSSMKKERKERIIEKRTNFVVKWASIHTRAASIFGKKSDAVCVIFFYVFLCGFAVFELPLCPPPWVKPLAI